MSPTPSPDQSRLAADRTQPRLMALWWAMAPLRSVVRFMNSGAHPDDETSAMLAALAFRDGINLSYACSTRGEGGQNDIGREAGPALGALRTREMERACDVLAMRMYWLSDSPDDPITDFGFSKSGTETMGLWGVDRTLARFVEIVRRERPDILCPTFLDIPGQHGHHRAMTAAAHRVMALAADPGFASNQPPWQVAKLYLPAWFGAGQAYDDDLPPPPATLTVDGRGRDPVSGWSWARIGQQSRAYHRTQGMGRWIPADDPGQDWPLHLAECHVDGPDTALWSGVPRRVGDLADMAGAGAMAPHARAAGEAIDACLAAYPDGPAMAAAAVKADAALESAIATCPDPLRDQVAHRLEAKRAQLALVVRLALGVEARGRVDQPFFSPGRPVSLGMECHGGAAEAVDVALDLPRGWTRQAGETPGAFTLTATTDAAPVNAYRDHYDPARPDAPALSVRVTTGGRVFESRIALDTSPALLPAFGAEVTPAALVLNRAGENRRLASRIVTDTGGSEAPDLSLPQGWSLTLSGGEAVLSLPEAVAPGLSVLPLTRAGQPVSTVTRITHDHIAPTALIRPAVLSVRVIDVALAEARIAYIGAGNDQVAHWLRAMGADVTEIAPEDLDAAGRLAGFDTLVIGIFAMRFRDGLAQRMPEVHRWVEAGGTLVTLYHRPWDNWDPATTPPRRLEIGQPSLRWRVTDANAPVTHLAPEHPILTTPNRIGPEDWTGWAKERGLYFAKEWDPAYQPLVEMADPGESPHRGALLAADIGAGRHVHVALILHHQMGQLVEGAFRLFANLVAPRR